MSFMCVHSGAWRAPECTHMNDTAFLLCPVSFMCVVCAFLGMESPRIDLILVLEGLYSIIAG